MAIVAPQQIDANFRTISSNEAFVLESTWTFAAATTGAIGQHTVFTVTGNVMAIAFGICDTALDSGGAATISLGSAGNVGAYIAATTATTIDDGDVWDNPTPSVQIGTLDNLNGTGAGYMINDGSDITIGILTATITAGVIDFYCLWRPLSSDGAIIVTAPA